MKNLLIIFLICFCESVYGQGFPFVNPSTLTNAFIVAHHSTGTGGVRLDSLISPSDGNGMFSVANEGGAIVIATATYADDIVLTGDNGVTRLASDYDESFLFTLVNKNAIFLDSNTVYLGLDDGTRAYLELEGLHANYEGSTFSFANKTSQPVPVIQVKDLDQSNFYGIKAPDVITTNYTEILPTAPPGANGMVKTYDTDGTTQFEDAGEALLDNSTIFASGGWTPSFSGLVNDTLLTNHGGYYTRVGNVVQFSFMVDMAMTPSQISGTFTTDLPVATDFTDTQAEANIQIGYYKYAVSGSAAIKPGFKTLDTINDDIDFTHYPETGTVEAYPANRYRITVTGFYEIQ